MEKIDFLEKFVVPRIDVSIWDNLVLGEKKFCNKNSIVYETKDFYSAIIFTILSTNHYLINNSFDEILTVKYNTDKFQEELKITSSLKGKNNIAVYDDKIIYKIIIDKSFYGYVSVIKIEKLYSVYELIGKDLVDNSEKILLKLALDIANAIKEAHKPHKNIRIQDIFLATNGNFKLGNFESFVYLENKKCNEFTYYSAPETFNENSDVTDQQTDLYSFGVCLYQLVNIKKKSQTIGEYDFNDVLSAMELPLMDLPLYVHKINVPNNVSIRFYEIVLKLLSYKRIDRYKDIDEVIRDLKLIHHTQFETIYIPSSFSCTVFYDSKLHMIIELQTYKEVKKGIFDELVNIGFAEKNKLSASNEKKTKKTILILTLMFSCVIIILSLIVFLKHDSAFESTSLSNQEDEFVLGDLNGDGKVTKEDYELIKKYGTKDNLPIELLDVADIKNDGFFDTNDVVEFRRKFPKECNQE